MSIYDVSPGAPRMRAPCAYLLFAAALSAACATVDELAQPSAEVLEPACQARYPEFHPAAADAITMPVRIKRDFKYFPRFLVEADISGRVVLNVEVTAAGRVRCIRIVKGSGHPTLDDTAVANMARFQFLPAEIDGHPVDAILRHTYSFIFYDDPAPAPTRIPEYTDGPG